MEKRGRCGDKPRPLFLKKSPMKKYEVLESFAGLYVHGTRGQVIELSSDEAAGLMRCGIVKLVSAEEQPEEPMAYETAKQAVDAETATKRKGRPRK